jgi:phosphate transport system permease protein
LSHSRNDVILLWILRGCALVTGTVVLLIALFLFLESIPALRSVGIARFVTDASWHPASGSTDSEFNLLPMIIATVLATTGAIVVATPLGIGSAVFSHFYAPRVLGQAYGKVIELLAGIPSVVYGMWGLVVLVPIVAGWQPPGASLLSAIVVLTIMIVPTIALVSGATFDNLPREYLESAAALGLSRWGTVWGIVLPASRSGLFTAVLLGAGRAIGETMAVLMVAGNVVRSPTSIFHPVRTLTANIALEMAYAMGYHRAALFVCGLILMLMVVALVSLAESLSKGRLYD